jgi:hypothetical protein
MPITLSLTPTAVTTTTSSRPRVSVMMPRLRPTIFLPASVPWVATGTLVEVLMLDVSQVDRRTGRDWPYTEKQMKEKFAPQDPAQQLYPPAGRRGRRATRVRLTF